MAGDVPAAGLVFSQAWTPLTAPTRCPGQIEGVLGQQEHYCAPAELIARRRTGLALRSAQAPRRPSARWPCRARFEPHRRGPPRCSGYGSFPAFSQRGRRASSFRGAWRWQLLGQGGPRQDIATGGADSSGSVRSPHPVALRALLRCGSEPRRLRASLGPDRGCSHGRAACREQDGDDDDRYRNSRYFESRRGSGRFVAAAAGSDADSPHRPSLRDRHRRLGRCARTLASGKRNVPRAGSEVGGGHASGAGLPPGFGLRGRLRHVRDMGDREECRQQVQGGALRTAYAADVLAPAVASFVRERLLRGDVLNGLRCGSTARRDAPARAPPRSHAHRS